MWERQDAVLHAPARRRRKAPGRLLGLPEARFPAGRPNAREAWGRVSAIPITRPDYLIEVWRTAPVKSAQRLPLDRGRRIAPFAISHHAPKPWRVAWPNPSRRLRPDASAAAPANPAPISVCKPLQVRCALQLRGWSHASTGVSLVEAGAGSRRG